MTDRTAQPRGPTHAPRVPFALLLLGLVVGGMCLLLLLNTASAANEVRRHDFAAKDAGVAAQVQQLQNQVAASAAPGALGSAAAQLGMVPAGNPAFLEIGPNGSVRVLGSPAPASAAVAPPPRRAGTAGHNASRSSAKPADARKSTAMARRRRETTRPRPRHTQAAAHAHTDHHARRHPMTPRRPPRRPPRRQPPWRATPP